MKKLYTSLLALLLPFTFQLSTLFAQNDTIYFMKDGLIVNKQSIKMADLDSAIFYQPTIPEPTSGTFTDDRDNKVYKWVKIGDQIWMAENLKYLPSVVGPGTGSETTPYYYVYGYDGTNVADAKATDNYATYGVLYNWTAAMDGEASSTTNPSGIQGVCPAGWHLPSDAEWIELTDYLGGTSVAGGKLKETGFTALPGGRRFNGSFEDIGYVVDWWSATEDRASFAWGRSMISTNSNVYRGYNYKEVGYFVRCVRD